MSKFDYGDFSDGDFAVNAEKYSEMEAVKIFERETECVVGFEKGDYSVHFRYVRWGFGYYDGEKYCGWWLEDSPRPKGSCKVYSFERIV